MGMGAHFFGLMPRLWSVRVFKVLPPGVDNAGAMAENLSARGYPHRSIPFTIGGLLTADGSERLELDDAEFEEGKLGAGSSSLSPRMGWTASASEDSEEVVLKELIQAWNRYCPVLREVQLKAGYVWRRADPDDVWAQRTVKVSRVRNAGFEEV